ncbi:HAMP domain-containing histidine kinase [candidate division KSB1 bacterium]|nr:HAMP domain-containing histidine kinase [candidate division KSB1 bacterium]
MLFKSFYPRVISILASVSLALFAVLAVINAYFFRVAIDDLMGKLQTQRMQRLFASLEKRFPQSAPPETLTAFLDSLYFEYAIEIYDRNGIRIAGNTAQRESPPEPRLHEEQRFTGFSKIYYNLKPTSPFVALKIQVHLPDAPVFRSVLILFLLSGLAIVAVSIVMGWKMVSYLNTRLERLKAGVSEIAQGRFDVQLPIAGEDEIAFLAKNFNAMSARLKRLIESLEESNAARQRLFAHASHEIKSPLTSIKGFVDIVEYMNVLPPEQQQHLVPAVKKDLNRVLKITNDLLQLARIRSPEYKFDYKQIELRSFLEEEHNFFAQKARALNAEARLVSKLNEPVQLHTDPDRLAQILDNLWSNSLKYGDLTHSIRTELARTHDGIAITIVNHLKGKLAVPVERLFEPFYRNPIDADKITGSGLGLAIAKELTEKLGGTIATNLEAHRIAVTIRFPLLEKAYAQSF